MTSLWVFLVAFIYGLFARYAAASASASAAAASASAIARHGSCSYRYNTPRAAQKKKETKHRDILTPARIQTGAPNARHGRAD